MRKRLDEGVGQLRASVKVIAAYADAGTARRGLRLLIGQRHAREAVAVEHQAAAELRQRLGDGRLEPGVVRRVVARNQRRALCLGQPAPQRRPLRGRCIDHAHAARGHRLVRVLREALHVHHQPAHRRAHDVRRLRAGKQRERVMVRHAQQFLLQRRVVQHEGRARLRRHRRGIVRHVQHHPGRIGLRRHHGSMSPSALSGSVTSKPPASQTAAYRIFAISRAERSSLAPEHRARICR